MLSSWSRSREDYGLASVQMLFGLSEVLRLLRANASGTPSHSAHGMMVQFVWETVTVHIAVQLQRCCRRHPHQRELLETDRLQRVLLQKYGRRLEHFVCKRNMAIMSTSHGTPKFNSDTVSDTVPHNWTGLACGQFQREEFKYRTVHHLWGPGADSISPQTQTSKGKETQSNHIIPPIILLLRPPFLCCTMSSPASETMCWRLRIKNQSMCPCRPQMVLSRKSSELSRPKPQRTENGHSSC